MSSRLTRRGFLKIVGFGGLGVLLNACSQRLGIPLTATSIPIPEPNSTATTSHSAEILPSPTIEAIPTYVPGEFEYDFNHNMPGYIPAEIEGAGGTGEILFNDAESVPGGEIVTNHIKVAGYSPLAVEGITLSTERDRVTYLAYPSEMQWLNERDELEVLTRSPEHSGTGFRAYVDSRGRVRRKMLTQIPSFEGLVYENGGFSPFPEGTWISAVSYNQEDRGNVYALRLDGAGHILQRIPLVFEGEDDIRVIAADGNVYILLNGERVLPSENRLEGTSEIGFTGTYILDEIGGVPEELLASIEPGTLRYPRFTNENGIPLPYGFNGVKSFSSSAYPPQNWDRPYVFTEYQMGYRGEIELPSGHRLIGVQRFFLFEIPNEVFDPQVGEIVSLGSSQFMVLTQAEAEVSGVHVPVLGAGEYDLRNLESAGRALDGDELASLLVNLQPGTPIIIWLVHYQRSVIIDSRQDPGAVEGNRAEETRVIEALIRREPITSPLMYNIMGATVGIPR